jgi:hypothetical protein
MSYITVAIVATAVVTLTDALLPWLQVLLLLVQWLW